MPLKVNGTTIADGGEIYLNGNKPTVITVNGVQVWDSAGAGWVRVSKDWIDGSPEGRATVTGSGNNFTFTPPAGVTHVNVCIMGGGGGGSRRHYSGQFAGGGMSGALNFQLDMLVDENPITISIGEGGLGAFDVSHINGYNGISTWFREFEALGGVGGESRTTVGFWYYGIGLPRSICNMTTYDGILAPGTFAYGGQAGLGNGGAGGFYNGFPGAFGGGGGATDQQDSNPGMGGQGGHGVVMISWS